MLDWDPLNVGIFLYWNIKWTFGLCHLMSSPVLLWANGYSTPLYRSNYEHSQAHVRTSNKSEKSKVNSHIFYNFMLSTICLLSCRLWCILPIWIFSNVREPLALIWERSYGWLLCFHRILNNLIFLLRFAGYCQCLADNKVNNI